MNTNNLGVMVKAARLDRGWTQAQLAEKAGVTDRHIMGIENEGYTPSFELFEFFIREFNLSADSVFYPETHGDTQLKYLCRLLGKCSERDIKVLTATAQSMLEHGSD